MHLGQNPKQAFFAVKSVSKLVVALCWMALCADALANCLKNTNIQLFGKKHSQCHTLRILPIRLMDDETLFLSAAAQRDHSMSPVNKLLNNRWLLQSSENTYSGPRALRTALRLSVVNVWQSKYGAQEPSRQQSRHNTKPPRPLFNISNYDIDFSEDRMMLGFSFRF